MEGRGFWDTLPKPFFALAPLANVTDAAFRRLIATYSKPFGPDVMYTEFVSADGLMLAGEEGRRKLMRDLLFAESERPIVAQFFTSRPEIMEQAGALAAKLGFDGVDINMGCPDRTIEKQGAGAALMKDPMLGAQLIAAAHRGVGGKIPVSIKARIGYNKDTLEEWLPVLLKAEPAAVIIHARTRKEMSKVPAHWERVARAVEIRDALASDTLIVGNGDVRDLADARAKIKETGADGAMLGRAIFGRPWLFDESANPSVEKRLRIAAQHAKLFEELLGDIKSFAIMKKHFKAYVEEFPACAGRQGAKELRVHLMETNNAAEVEQVIEKFLGGMPHEITSARV